MSELIDTRTESEHPPVTHAYKAMLHHTSVTLIVAAERSISSIRQMAKNMGYEVTDRRREDGIYVYLNKPTPPSDKGHLILLFDSATRVLLAEKILKQADIEHKVIPTPRKVSSECGLSIRIPETVLDRVRDALDERITIRDVCPLS